MKGLLITSRDVLMIESVVILVANIKYVATYIDNIAIMLLISCTDIFHLIGF